MEKDVFSVGVIQMDSREDMRMNLSMGRDYAAQAAKQGADLIIFPETMEYIGPNLAKHAQKIPGEMLSYYRELATTYGIYVHGGSITRQVGGRKPANSSLLLNPKGELIAQYSKLHMFDVMLEDGPSYRESKSMASGNEIVVAKTDFAAFGMAICYDLRFPEMFRLQAEHGAQVILLAANFTDDTGKAHWETLLRARAIENTCYVVACNQTGEKTAFRAHGHSMVINPWGEVVQSMEDQAGVMVVPIDLSYAKKIRKQLPSLENIRKDVYSLDSAHVKVYENSQLFLL